MLAQRKRQGRARGGVRLVGPPFSIGAAFERTDDDAAFTLDLAEAKPTDEVEIDRAHRRAEIGVALRKPG